MLGLPVFDTQYLCMKVGDILKTLPICDREDHKKAIPLAHILFPHGTKFFLTSSIKH